MTTTFENARVGDKVYSLRFGEGEIIEVKELTSNPKECMKITVRFSDTHIESFSKAGYFSHQEINRDLFWSKPTIIAPEQPKRKKTITHEVWLNLYIDMNGLYASDDVWPDHQTAFDNRDKLTTYIGTYKFTSEPFEVDED